MRKFVSKLKSDKSFLFSFVIGICIVSVLCFSVATFAFFLSDNKEYESADEKMDDANTMLSEAFNDIDSVSDAIDDDLDDVEEDIILEKDFSQFGDGDRTYNDYLEEIKGKKAHKTDPLMYKRIDFDKLEDVNLDEVAGWLYIPNSSIDYIVMHGNEIEEYKYLWKDPHGNESSTGSLFVKYEESEDIDDHTVIYGHRLKDHSLYFGELFNYRDDFYANDHSIVYYYTKDRVYRYILYSVNDGQESDAVYLYPYTINTDDYNWLIQDVNDHANFVMDNRKYDPAKRMLILSTCSGVAAGMPDRFYIVLEEDCYWDYE